MTEEVFYCTTDEDSFTDLQDAVEFIGNVSSDLNDALGWNIEVHKKYKPTHNRFVCGQQLIEYIADRAGDEFSEYSEGYLDDVMLDEAKYQELGEIVSDWLDKNSAQPTFFQSVGKIDDIIVDQALLDQYGVEF
ncbi:MAG: hypothetical protein [Caudoviricetes sp.]|nr:MAG: hypothetical protein [Caudoviricetes sp.]